MAQDEAAAPRVDIAKWSDASSREAIELIAQSVLEMVGFQVACVSVVLDGVLVTVTVCGDESARAELLGATYPISVIEEELRTGQDWGRFKFVPEDLSAEQSGPYWIPPIDPVDHPDAWRPYDLLLAPLHGREGEWIGMMSIDMPVSGLRPDATQRGLLERYAAQAERAVLLALERADLAEQIRLADAARTLVRAASGQPSLAGILQECREPLVSGFRARGLWIEVLDDAGPTSGAEHSAAGSQVTLPPHVAAVAERTARTLWAEQRASVLVAGGEPGRFLTDDEHEEMEQLLLGLGLDSLLFVPLGAGRECLGFLALTRAPGDRRWSDVEGDSALDIGRDLGAAILNARAFEREHQLVDELQKLDGYKSQLIATVSHELKNPLSAIVGHLEMLEYAEELTTDTRGSLAAMERGAIRLGRVVDDLLLLSTVGDPHNPVLASPVDVRRVVDGVLVLASVTAQRRSVRLVVEAADPAPVAAGDADELDRLVANLVSNAVKYSLPDTTVTISLHQESDDVVISVADEGIGIAEEEQPHLFTEFFRSADPVALAEPGTGLGLAIAARIVERHGGRIDVVSALGRGSTFTVRLPASTDSASRADRRG